MRSIDTLIAAGATAVAEPEAKPIQGEVFIARFAGLDVDGRFQLTCEDNSQAVVALSSIGLGPLDEGTQVVVARESQGGRLVIIGRLQERATPATTGVRVDGDRVLIQADRQIELRCGSASLILTRAGKVLIRGDYVLTRSRGANRIKGAVVDIN